MTKLLHQARVQRSVQLWLRIVTAAILCLGTASAALAQGEQVIEDTEKLEMNLSVGENKTLPAKAIKSYSEGTAGVIEVRITPEANEFVIVGKKAGATTLLLIPYRGKRKLYNINVFDRPMGAVEGELKRLLQGNTGIRVRRIGPRLFIEGGVNNEQELARIQRIASLYPGQVESLVVVGGVAADRKHNIKLDVYFVQVEKTKGYSVGVSWPGRIGPANTSISYDLVAGEYASGTASIVNQALLGLDIAAANGWAKVLKRSTVITANGSEAEFNSGGEQNYEVNTGLATSLQSLKFGTDVSVRPRFDASTNEIEIKVDAELSELTAPVDSTARLPGRNTTTLGTLVNLKLGQAVILSGIQSRIQRHSVGGLPLLSELPLLGLLFGNHDDQLQDVDGAILIVPSVVESIPKKNEQLIQELLDVYEEMEDEDLINPLKRQWPERDPAGFGDSFGSGDAANMKDVKPVPAPSK